MKPQQIPRDLYQKFLDNDLETAHQYAFNYDLLKRNGVRVADNVEYVIEGESVDLSTTAKSQLHIQLVVSQGAGVRLDTVLMNKTGLSRRRVEQLFESSAFEFLPPGISNLKKRISSNLMIVVDVDKARKGLGEAPAQQ